MNSAPDPVDPLRPLQGPGISAAADRARERLHEEIERVRIGVEEMLAEQGGEDTELRKELDAVREETRRYVRKRVRKSERRIERSVRKIDQRTRELERRLEGFEADRRYAEWRIHTNTEAMLDGLLAEVRSIADRLTR